ncbi:MAG: substrate-binding domain-containing protein [Pseudomonadota bacterium]
MKKVLIFILSFVSLCVFFVTPTFAKVLIIANNSVPQESLNKEELQNIFLGKMAKWSDNTSIYFVTSETDAHEDFLKMYINRSSSQFRNYWRKMVFTGKGQKPKAFKTDEELIQFVSETSGAIGYVGSDAALTNVKTITVN